MPVKDVYGKEVSEQNHMVFAYNPLSMLINEIKNKKMSDGITEARRGTYWLNDKYNHDDSIINPELYGKIKNTKDVKLDTKFKDFKHMPNQRLHKVVSLIKSTIRIGGYLLIPFSIPAAVGVLVLSEIIGIIEELV
jgi:hypothetical protein